MTATTPREMIQAMPLNIAKPLAVAYCQWCMQRALAAADKVQHLMPADGQRLYEELKENIRTGTTSVTAKSISAKNPRWVAWRPRTDWAERVFSD